MKLTNTLAFAALLSTATHVFGQSDRYVGVKAPEQKSELYLWTYESIKINSAGVACYSKGEDYAEFSLENSSTPYVNGIINGVGYCWVQGGIDPGENISFKRGQVIYRDEETGQEIFIYPANVETDPTGKQLIVAAPSSGYFNEEVSEIKFLYLEEGKYKGSCYDADGYAAFIENEEGGLVCLNNELIVKSIYTSLGETSYYPPLESTPDICQVVSYNIDGASCCKGAKNYNLSSDTPMEYLQGMLGNMVLTNDALYLNNTAGIGSCNWIKGDITGNTVTFKRGQALGRSGRKLGTYALDIPGNNIYQRVAIKPVEEDLTLTIDVNAKTLSAPSAAFTCAPEIDNKIEIYPEQSDILISWNDVVCGADVRPWTDQPLKPMSPLNLRYSFSYSGDIIDVNIPYFSEDRTMLDPSKLYYRFYLNGNPYYPYFLQSRGIWEIPFIGHSVLSYSEQENILAKDTLREIYTGYEFDDDTDVLGCQTVYYGGDSITESDIVYYTESSVDAIASENQTDAPIYNILGQPADKNNLAPGVYVSKGNKFIAK